MISWCFTQTEKAEASTLCGKVDTFSLDSMTVISSSFAIKTRVYLPPARYELCSLKIQDTEAKYDHGIHFERRCGDICSLMTCRSSKHREETLMVNVYIGLVFWLS